MTNDLMLYAVLALMLAAAVLTVVTDRLLTAVIFAGALSAFAALGYLLLGAPDVALAEVVVGATLATVIFLVTLKKYRIFTVHLTGSAAPGCEEHLKTAIERALQAHELEPHLLHAHEEAAALLARPGCDLVAAMRGETVILHGEQSSPYVCGILSALQAEGFSVTLNGGTPPETAAPAEGRV